MSKFFFCNNVFKCHMLQRCLKASIRGKGLNESKEIEVSTQAKIFRISDPIDFTRQNPFVSHFFAMNQFLRQIKYLTSQTKRRCILTNQLYKPFCIHSDPERFLIKSTIFSRSNPLQAFSFFENKKTFWDCFLGWFLTFSKILRIVWRCGECNPICSFKIMK